MPVDPSTLAAWRKLCEEATAGPWTHRVDHGSLRERIHRITYLASGLNEGAEFFAVDIVESTEGNESANAAFIATARNAFPRLLDAVENLTDSVRQHTDVSCELAQENATLRAECERLRAVYEASVAMRVAENSGDSPKGDLVSIAEMEAWAQMAEARTKRVLFAWRQVMDAALDSARSAEERR